MQERFNDFDPYHGIDFDDEPPAEGPELFIQRLRANQQFTYVILGALPRGVMTHWDGRCSIPHFKDAARCIGCQKHIGIKWKGYLHCLCIDKNQEVFLELTPFSRNSLVKQLGKPKSMRGNRMNVKRGKADNGRLTIAVLARHPDPEQLPPERDPRPSVMTLYGFNKNDMDEAAGGPEINGHPVDLLGGQ